LAIDLDQLAAFPARLHHAVRLVVVHKLDVLAPATIPQPPPPTFGPFPYRPEAVLFGYPLSRKPRSRMPARVCSPSNRLAVLLDLTRQHFPAILEPRLHLARDRYPVIDACQELLDALLVT
jgi:hypothetical protein